MDTDSFIQIVYIKLDYIYEDTAENVETRSETSNDKLKKSREKLSV